MVANAISSGTMAALDYPTSDGQLNIGRTGDVPVNATLTAGLGVTITNGAGSISIAATESGSAFVTVAGTTQAMAPDTTYMNLNSGVTVFSLPTTCPAGASVSVIGYGAGSGTFQITNTVSQQILFLDAVTSTPGFISSDSPTQYIKLKCMIADILFQVIDYTGQNFNVYF